MNLRTCTKPNNLDRIQRSLPRGRDHPNGTKRVPSFLTHTHEEPNSDEEDLHPAIRQLITRAQHLRDSGAQTMVPLRRKSASARGKHEVKNLGYGQVIATKNKQTVERKKTLQEEEAVQEAFLAHQNTSSR